MTDPYSSDTASTGAAAQSPPVLERIAALHSPVEEEAEFWAESGRDDGAEHDRRFPECPGGDRCEGHTATVKVCTECGYEHDGEQPIYRFWPCPTYRLATEQSGEQPAAAAVPHRDGVER